jgi:allantoinase
VLDDEPVTLKTTHKPVIALPYNFELHDIVMMDRRVIDAFNCLYAESAERAKIMAIACHPYLSGQPHRIGYVEGAYAEILERPGVACWDGEKILDWYLTMQKVAA